jgi:hypothetical protein
MRRTSGRPVPFAPPGDWRLDAVTLLAALYEPDERINYVVDYIAAPDKSGTLKARPQGIGETVERDALIPRWTQTMPSSPAGGWLRMNPVDGCGVADANVTAFRFALLECDSIPLGLQLSLFARLPLPIAAILTSGGRSFHAWVKVDASDADDYRAVVSRMLNLLSRCGVDRKNKNPARLSRLPGVRRTIGADGPGLQRLLYLNPDPQQRTIL